MAYHGLDKVSGNNTICDGEDAYSLDLSIDRDVKESDICAPCHKSLAHFSPLGLGDIRQDLVVTHNDYVWLLLINHRLELIDIIYFVVHNGDMIGVKSCLQ